MRKWSRLFRLLIILTLMIRLVPAANAVSDDSDMLDEAKKGVVQILTVNTQNTDQWCTGTGFAIGREGKDSDVFLTNWHVVTCDGEWTDHARVFILTEDGAIECKVLKTTAGYPDYAVIQAIDGCSGYKALPLYSSEKVKSGIPVYALGYPGAIDDISTTHSGIDDITMTTGIVSRHMVANDPANTNVLVHDATVNHGNSGGPLINQAGAVIGLNTYIYSDNAGDGNTYSLAVYIDYCMEALDSLGIHYDVYDPDAPAQTEPSIPKSTEDVWAEEKDTSSSHDTYYNIAAIIGGTVSIGAFLLFISLFFTHKKKSSAPAAKSQAPVPKQPAAASVVPPVQQAPQPVSSPQQAAPQPAQAAPKPMQQFVPSGYSLRLPDGSVRQIPASGMSIGRDPSCVLQLPDYTKGVSRTHCVLVMKGSTLVLQDVGSTYGTFIHGQKVPPKALVALKKGSSFCLGTEANRFTVC